MNKTIVLIIYLLSFYCSNAQTLQLEYQASQKNEQITLDSITNNKSFSNFKNLKKHNDSLIGKLYHTGYINLLAQPLQRISEHNYLQKIELNKKFKTIEIIANTVNKEIDSLVEITLSRKQNKNFFPIERTEEKIKEIHQFITKNGFSFLKIQTSEFEMKKGDTITLRINLSIDKKRRIDNIIIKGYSQFPKKYIGRIVNKKLLFNEENISNIQSAINKIPFITIEKEPEILFKKDSTIVYVYVKKKNSNAADGLIGFNNSKNGKLELNGYIDLTLFNNLDNGEKLTILYRGDNDDQTSLDIKTELPYILKSNIGISAGLNLLRRDSTYQNTMVRVGAFYSVTQHTSLGISYSQKESIVNDITNFTDNFNNSSISLSFNHQQPSFQEIYVNNALAKIEIGYGQRNIDETRNRQIQITSTIQKNLTIDESQSIHLENQIKYLGSKNILFNELFQVGGINSIRGFNQNSIDTSLFTSINTEYRYLLSEGIYLHSILDYAVFEDFTTKKTQKIYGFGLGTAILTQSGILRLSIANGSFSGANLDFSSTVAHINLLIKF